MPCYNSCWQSAIQHLLLVIMCFKYCLLKEPCFVIIKIFCTGSHLKRGIQVNVWVWCSKVCISSFFGLHFSRKFDKLTDEETFAKIFGERLFVGSYWSLSSEYAVVEVSFGLWERKWNLRFGRTFAGIKDFTCHLSEGSLLARLYIGIL